MALQIANPTVIEKIEAMAKAAGLTKTAAVEKAVDAFMHEQKKSAQPEKAWRRFEALLEQIDRIPDLAHPFNPLEWDEHGLPR